MERDYKNAKKTSTVKFFVGKEIEYNNMFGELTLFVVSPQSTSDIEEKIKEVEKEYKQKIKHIYLTANQSLPKLITCDSYFIKDQVDVLIKKYNVTIDGTLADIESIEHVLPMKNSKLHLIISVPMPKIKRFNKNTIVKIDDFGPSKSKNPGVWCFKLSKLMKKNKHFTAWKQYTKDKVL